MSYPMVDRAAERVTLVQGARRAAARDLHVAYNRNNLKAVDKAAHAAEVEIERVCEMAEELANLAANLGRWGPVETSERHVGAYNYTEQLMIADLVKIAPAVRRQHDLASSREPRRRGPAVEAGFRRCRRTWTLCVRSTRTGNAATSAHPTGRNPQIENADADEFWPAVRENWP